MTPAAAAARRAVQSRNATEEAILDAAREALAEKGFDSLTMDAIARKAFVSRTAVYFYFPNKRAVVDRLIQHAFSEMYLAASPYLDGDGDPRKELYAGLARVVSSVNRHARVLLLAAQLSGHRGEHLPDEWAPFITRFAERAEARIARDQEHGIAPADISPRLSAQALLAMVENHIVRELVLGRGDATESIRVLAELWWRAVYSRPDDVAASVAEATEGVALAAAASAATALEPEAAAAVAARESRAVRTPAASS